MSPAEPAARAHEELGDERPVAVRGRRPGGHRDPRTVQRREARGTAMASPMSGVVSVRGPARSAATVTSAAGPASFTTVPVSVGPNRNVVVGDVTNSFEHSSGPACHVGDQTPQNETAISMDPTESNNLIGGANDHRYFVSWEQRYDGSAAAYVSHDGGATWANVFMPGISEEAGGTYQGVGHPASRGRGTPAPSTTRTSRSTGKPTRRPATRPSPAPSR